MLGALVNDWTLTGVLTLQSGVPIAITQTTNNNAFAGFGTQRPNLVGDPTLPADERSVSRWFNTVRSRPHHSSRLARALAIQCADPAIAISTRRDAARAAIAGNALELRGGSLQRDEHPTIRCTQHDGRLRGLRDHHVGRRSACRSTGAEVPLLKTLR